MYASFIAQAGYPSPYLSASASGEKRERGASYGVGTFRPGFKPGVVNGLVGAMYLLVKNTPEPVFV
jgi:hypothetical protein